mgnify:CR=1 FL=1
MTTLCAAQDLDPNKKQVNASRTKEAINIDGELSEASWQSAIPTEGFTTLEPSAGEAASKRTEVRILYDDGGMYIAAKMYDPEPQLIPTQLVQRDDIGNADWFGIFIDPYRDGNNGVSFIVTSSNVQFDAKYSTFGEDESWDAVWESQVQIVSDGWIAELWVPYSAMRFPETEQQTWHVNFGRLDRRIQEKSFWSEIDPNQNGFLNQAGYLTGIKNIKPPVRIQATPFVAVYGENYHDKSSDPVNSFGHSINGGMDIKVGLSDAFTLDMTLIPDFGEAQSDNNVLNLSPFEVRFDENRQFFTEGTELFNKGNLFYSRRVGGRPIFAGRVNEEKADDETIVSNPAQAQLINATKISGRTEKGLGIGFFNATSKETFATLRSEERGDRQVLIDPLTNYNVFVLDQNLKNNSFISLVNTNVLREGSAYDANVTAGVLDLKNKKQSFGISGQYKLSQKYYTDETQLGHAANFNIRKISGNWNFGLQYNEESDTYDINDLGFLNNNNERTFGMFQEYNVYKPFSIFNRGGLGMFSGYEMLYKPNTFTNWGTEMWAWGQLKNFWRVNIFNFIRPVEGYDYFEPRTQGRYFRTPTSNSLGFFINSDQRKRLTMRIFGRFQTFGESGRKTRSVELGPAFRVNDHLNFQWGIDFTDRKNDIGFVNKVSNEFDSEDIIFGRRDVSTIVNTFNAAYNFNSNMALTFRMRHYWSKVAYGEFNLLEENGRLGLTDYNQMHDTNFNAFNIDMIYRWRFAPGSDLFIIWKDAILNFQETSELSYFQNLDGLFENPQRNSISVKLIYFLDYVNLQKKRGR